MALVEPTFKRRAESIVDLPDDREYDSEADAELDEALANAIEKADAAGNDFLSGVLRYQLGAFYLQRK